MGQRSVPRSAALLAVGWALVACSPAQPSSPPAAPRPPAACLLDTGKLAATTGIPWAAEASTASDVRCVYDPTGADDDAAGTAFLTVALAGRTAADAATELATLGQLCDTDSRAPVAAFDGAFVCRFQGSSIFAAVVRGQQVETLSASAVPKGTTAAKLVLAVREQLTGAA